MGTVSKTQDPRLIEFIIKEGKMGIDIAPKLLLEGSHIISTSMLDIASHVAKDTSTGGSTISCL